LTVEKIEFNIFPLQFDKDLRESVTKTLV